MNVFRNYTQAELELQYDSAARSPELTARRDARSALVDAASTKVRSSAKAVLDMAYGPHAREKIDVFQPAQPKGPLFAFIHGGYWKQRSKDEFAWMAPAFTDAGVTFASIGYPLCPEVGIGDIVGSIQRAMLCLSANAATLGFDPKQIHVAGHSAGGHLAAMMAATDFYELGGPAALITSATCVSGLYDLAPLRKVKLNADLKITPDEVEPLSPLHLGAMPHVVINLTVGDREAAEFVRNTTELSAAWRSLDIDVTDVPAPGFYHFDVLDELGNPGRPMHKRVMRVMLG